MRHRKDLDQRRADCGVPEMTPKPVCTDVPRSLWQRDEGIGPSVTDDVSKRIDSFGSIQTKLRRVRFQIVVKVGQ